MSGDRRPSRPALNDSTHRAAPDSRVEDAPGRRVRCLVQMYGRKRLAQAAELSAETIRRYELGDSMSIRFVQSVIRDLGISAEWMLHGVGQVREEDRRREILSSFSPVECAGELIRRAAVVEREPKAERGQGDAGKRSEVGCDSENRSALGNRRQRTVEILATSPE